MEPRPAQGDVAKLPVLTRAAQEETAAAHVAASDEVLGEQEPREDVDQDLGVLRRRDASQEDDVGLRRPTGQEAGVSEKRLSIALLGGIHRNLSEAAQIAHRDRRLRRLQAVAGSDDENA